MYVCMLFTGANLDLVGTDLFTVHLTQSSHYTVDVVELDERVRLRVTLMLYLDVLTTTRTQQCHRTKGKGVYLI